MFLYWVAAFSAGKIDCFSELEQCQETKREKRERKDRKRKNQSQKKIILITIINEQIQNKLSRKRQELVFYSVARDYWHLFI